VALLAALGGGVAAPQVEVTVKQRYLEPVGVDGEPAKAGDRQWRLDLRTHALAFTMRNEPRPGSTASGIRPGIAVISFTPEAGHRYEVEIRAPDETYSRRVWRQGEWTPVVRDRTADRLVSTAPEWRDSACGPP
jgi:hypothetical protein